MRARKGFTALCVVSGSGCRGLHSATTRKSTPTLDKQLFLAGISDIWLKEGRRSKVASLLLEKLSVGRVGWAAASARFVRLGFDVPFLEGVSCISACRAMTIRRAVSAVAPAAGPSSNRRAVGSTRASHGGGSWQEWALPSQRSDSCAASRPSPNRPLHRSFSRTSGCSTGDPLRCATGYACLSRGIGSRRSTQAKSALRKARGSSTAAAGPSCRA